MIVLFGDKEPIRNVDPGPIHNKFHLIRITWILLE